MNDLTFRLAHPEEFPAIRAMILESFEPITWYKKVQAKFGLLNGRDWRGRWDLRLDKVFATQIILVGIHDGEVAATATGTAQNDTRLGFIDLLAVDSKYQGRGWGRAMLRGMLDHFRSLGMEHAYLECLTDNDKGNRLYAAEGWELVASSNYWFVRIC